MDDMTQKPVPVNKPEKKTHLQRTCERIGWAPNAIVDPKEVDNSPNQDLVIARKKGYKWSNEENLPQHLRMVENI